MYQLGRPSDRVLALAPGLEQGLALWYPGSIGPNSLVESLRSGYYSNPAGKIVGTVTHNGHSIFPNAFSLDGSTGYIDTLGTSGSLPASGTISMWINPTNLINSNTSVGIFSSGAVSPAANWILWRFDDGAGKANFFLRSGGTYKLAATTTASWLAKVWYHVVATWDGSNIRVYVNGVQEAATACGSPDTSANPFDVNFGRSGNAGGSGFVYWNGRLADIRFYSRAITAEEVNVLYNSAFTPEQIELPSLWIDIQYKSVSDSLLPKTSETSSSEVVFQAYSVSDSLLPKITDTSSVSVVYPEFVSKLKAYALLNPNYAVSQEKAYALLNPGYATSQLKAYAVLEPFYPQLLGGKGKGKGQGQDKKLSTGPHGLNERPSASYIDAQERLLRPIVVAASPLDTGALTKGPLVRGGRLVR